MNWLSRLMNEDVVYWEPPIRDGYGSYIWGKALYLPNTRWEVTLESSVVGEGSDSNVWYSSTDRIIDIGAYLWRGNLEDLPDPNIKPDTLEDAFIASTVGAVRSLVDLDIILRKVELH